MVEYIVCNEKSWCAVEKNSQKFGCILPYGRTDGKCYLLIITTNYKSRMVMVEKLVNSEIVTKVCGRSFLIFFNRMT